MLLIYANELYVVAFSDVLILVLILFYVILPAHCVISSTTNEKLSTIVIVIKCYRMQWVYNFDIKI